ncbi:MAG: ATP-binding cassette domain-containing protein, partial [Clostridia bacterium]|nr:ATP-binding cassette domain-containing protein [Clostridia bacterium]
MQQIQCTDVTLGYDNNIILKDLSFAIDRGAYLCVVGENGSGKSTLVKALLRLIKP